MQHGDPFHLAFEILTGVRFRHLLPDWSADPDILGYGVGLRRTLFKDEPDRCLKVFVRRKQPGHALAMPIPKRLTLPGIADPVEIDVDTLPPLRPHGGLLVPEAANAIRMAEGGDQWGSFGCLLRNRFDDRMYLLGCGHVLAGGTAAAGDDLVVASPGSAPRPAARLVDWTVPVASETGFANTVDAAIADVVHGDVVDAVRAIQPTGITGDIRSGMTVFSAGAASGRQRGALVCERATFAVEMDIPGIGRRRIGYRDQIFCRDATTAGDSGACVVNDRGRAVGLHIMGTDGAAEGKPGEFSVATPFRAVLDAFAPSRALDLADLVDASVMAPERPPVNDPDDAIDVAARTIFGETRGEPPEGRLAIAEVIYNRAMRRSPRFGTSVEDVCRKPDQFSCWSPGDPNRARIHSISLAEPEIADCVDIARGLVDGRVGALTRGADHYHHWRVSPTYSRLRQPCARIGSHLFFNDIP